MRHSNSLLRTRLIPVALSILIVSVISTTADAFNLRVGLHGVRMEPNGSDAETYSKASWGGGLDLLWAPPNVHDLVAVVVGFEGIVFDSETTEYRERVTGLRIEQNTSQDLVRFFIGGRVGHQGHGSFRPYAGGHVGINHYSISSTVSIPDDFDPDKTITQDLGGVSDTGFGIDGALGIELNFSDKVYFDVGARYMKNFGVEQKLTEDSIEIEPEYIMIHAMVTVSVAWISRHTD